LLKGCEQPFHPQQASERYCSAACREQAREWSEWKAQQKYRATPAGTEKRKAQSQRYRERIRNRKEPTGEAADESARVISHKMFLIIPATGPDVTKTVAPVTICGLLLLLHPDAIFPRDVKYAILAVGSMGIAVYAYQDCEALRGTQWRRRLRPGHAAHTHHGNQHKFFYLDSEIVSPPSRKVASIRRRETDRASE
jgi:hypothetical protein